MDKKKCTAIVLSAGQGKRMGSAIQKQYIELSGKPIIFYTLDAFQKSAIIDDIVLVVGEGQENWVRDEIIEKYQLTKVRSIIPGGKERYDSVWAGLRGLHALKEQPEYVFIHDGARMFVDEQILTRGYENVEKFGLHEEHLYRKPAELSGGELQRAALSRLLVMEPKVIILDEPTSMLDVITQAQMIQMLREYQEKAGTSYVFITHNRTLCEEVCNRIYDVENGIVTLEES